MYASNFGFLRDKKSYFAAHDTRVLLHTWSLRVEEQFYFFVPLLLALGAGLLHLARRDVARSARALVTSLLVVITVASAWAASRVGVDVAFFASPLRAWQFCAGELVAVALPPPLRKRALAEACAAAGASLLAGSLAGVVDVVFPWPGALMPTLGTCLILAAHAGSSLAHEQPSVHSAPVTVVGRALAWAPLQALGRVSYALYLVHWPIVVLLPLAVGPTDGLLVPVLAFGSSLGGAVVLYRFVETPLRFHPRLTASTGTSLALALALMGGSAALGFAFWPPPKFSGRLADADAVGRSTIDVVRRCTATTAAALVKNGCVWGDDDGARTVLVVGDSHAMHWLGALDVFGAGDHVRVIYSGLSACPSAPVPQRKAPDGCAEWQSGLVALVGSVRPDLVLVADASVYVDDDRIAAVDAQGAWREANRILVGALDATGVPAAAVLDLPALRQNATDCFALRAADRCGPTAGDVQQARAVHAAMRAAWGEHPLFDPTVTRVFCPTAHAEPLGPESPGPMTGCAATVADKPMYRDRGHLTREGSEAFAADMGAFLRPLLAAPSSSQPSSQPSTIKGDRAPR
ncbi:MAG: acyltransferase [Deltaproteobacteria bacterium]|nr:acyltransferase [Deltaproteobacteria bacterium]